MEKWIEFEQVLNMHRFRVDRVFLLPDGNYTTLLHRDFPLKDRVRERFYASSLEGLIDQISQYIKK